MRKLSRPRGPLGRQLAVQRPADDCRSLLNVPPASVAGAPPTSTGGMVVTGPVKAPMGTVTLNSVAPTIQMAKMNPISLETGRRMAKNRGHRSRDSRYHREEVGVTGTASTTTTTGIIGGGVQIGKRNHGRRN